MKRTLAAFALLALATACSQSAQQSSQSSTAASPAGGSAAPAATNPIDFPLYQQSTVLASHDFKGNAASHMVSGVEVIAENPATLAQLGDWIKGIGTTPPTGYTLAPSSSAVETGRAKAQSLGVDFQVFTHDVGGKKRALIVLAVDPKTFNEKAGPLLSYIGKFKMLPQSMRDTIDGTVKSRTGFTVSDALDPQSPLGGALQAVDTLQSSGQRGIVLIDGTKD